jgi:TPR repeat protein
MSYTPISNYRPSKQPKKSSIKIVLIIIATVGGFLYFMISGKNNKSELTKSIVEPIQQPIQSNQSNQSNTISQDQAEQASAETQFKWGLQYSKGNGVAKNDQAAAAWWRRSAEKGYVKAQVNLAWAYETGVGLKQDFDSALMWYRKAADQNDAIAQNKLGIFYEQGIGIEKNTVAAVEWYRKAALQGLADAQNKLGIIYAQGIGEADTPIDSSKPSAPYINQQIKIPKDETAALEWFKKAANQGDIDAQYNLAIMYVNGLGTDRSDMQAYFWTTLSAAKGNKNAQDLNDIIANRLTPEQKTQANMTAQAWVPN